MIITNSDLLMKPKERVLKAIQWKEVDRPPVFATLTPHAAKKLSDHQGLPYEEPIDSLLASRASHNDLLVHMGNDCVGIAACYPETDPMMFVSFTSLLISMIPILEHAYNKIQI